ncbi:hypothetical protein CMI39_00160 [Candidatus Pacearchaeota archaeon]|mgnify:CR=1 FL=1|nr:hypothetical protein [Candidatus Pacearchaeota archaeon]
MQVKPFRIEGLDNQTDRHLSLFSKKKVEEYFGDVYATSYKLSFAGLAQAHRHRTIDYGIFGGNELGSPEGFFIPKIVPGWEIGEWLNDLRKIAKDDFPQAQLLNINERGIKEDSKSKMMLRLCGHAQYEIMENTKETTKKYAEHDSEIYVGKKPLCTPTGCKGCNWGNKYGINRIV